MMNLELFDSRHVDPMHLDPTNLDPMILDVLDDRHFYSKKTKPVSFSFFWALVYLPGGVGQPCAL